MELTMWLNPFCYWLQSGVCLFFTKGACRRHGRQDHPNLHRVHRVHQGRVSHRSLPICLQAGSDGTTRGTSHMNIWRLCTSLFVMSQR